MYMYTVVLVLKHVYMYIRDGVQCTCIHDLHVSCLVERQYTFRVET